jgi:hypothetical protein
MPLFGDISSTNPALDEEPQHSAKQKTQPSGTDVNHQAAKPG